MTFPFEPRPGQIILFETQAFDPTGAFITAEERDSTICHAAIVSQDRQLWSTGVAFPIRFGKVSLEQYLARRKYHVCQADLTDGQAAIIEALCASFEGQFYGFHKITILCLKARFGGVVRRLYPWLTKTIRNPFCSESVSADFWKAGLELCRHFPDGSPWKEEPSAITPANLYTYAQMKGSPLNIIFSSL